MVRSYFNDFHGWNSREPHAMFELPPDFADASLMQALMHQVSFFCVPLFFVFLL